MPQVTGNLKQQDRDNSEDSSMHQEGISNGKLSCCKDKEVRKLLLATRIMEDVMEPTDKAQCQDTFIKWPSSLQAFLVPSTQSFETIIPFITKQ